jgi:pyrroline-5-carboxylate reductase
LYRVGLVGAGNMGRAMISAWIESGTVKPEEIIVSEKDPEKIAAAVDSFNVRSGEIEDAASSDIVVLAVKPQDSADVLSRLKGRLDGSQTLLSIAAGLTISSLRKAAGPSPAVVRVMPNMGAMVRAAVSGYAIELGEGTFDAAAVTALLSAIGESVEVDEDMMNLVTAVSGSGPAYFFYLTEALEEAAVAAGMDGDVARLLARETLWGAAKTIKEKGADPGELRRAVSSPGGTTLAALSEMDAAGFRKIIADAIDAAARRAGELAT